MGEKQQACLSFSVIGKSFVIKPGDNGFAGPGSSNDQVAHPLMDVPFMFQCFQDTFLKRVWSKIKKWRVKTFAVTSLHGQSPS